MGVGRGIKQSPFLGLEVKAEVSQQQHTPLNCMENTEAASKMYVLKETMSLQKNTVIDSSPWHIPAENFLNEIKFLAVVPASYY